MKKENRRIRLDVDRGQAAIIFAALNVYQDGISDPSQREATERIVALVGERADIDPSAFRRRILQTVVSALISENPSTSQSEETTPNKSRRRGRPKGAKNKKKTVGTAKKAPKKIAKKKVAKKKSKEEVKKDSDPKSES